MCNHPRTMVAPTSHAVQLYNLSRDVVDMHQHQVGYTGKMEKKMETTTLLKGIYGGYIRIMEKKMETTILVPSPTVCIANKQQWDCEILVGRRAAQDVGEREALSSKLKIRTLNPQPLSPKHEILNLMSFCCTSVVAPASRSQSTTATCL